MLRGKLLDGSWKDYKEYEEKLHRTSGREAIEADDFYSALRQWEWNWITTPKNYPEKTYGNEFETARRMYKKWEKAL
jgi:hypothetical protein